MEKTLPGVLWRTRCGQKDKGHRVKGACVEGKQEVSHQSQDNVACPNLAEPDLFMLPWMHTRAGWTGRRRPSTNTAIRVDGVIVSGARQWTIVPRSSCPSSCDPFSQFTTPVASVTCNFMGLRVLLLVTVWIRTVMISPHRAQEILREMMRI